LDILTSQDLETLDEDAYEGYLGLLAEFVKDKGLEVVYGNSLAVFIKFGLKLLECKNVSAKSFGVKFLEHLRKKARDERELIKALTENFIRVIFSDPHEKILKDSEQLTLMVLRKPTESKELLAFVVRALIVCEDKAAFKALLDIVEKLIGSYGKQLLELLKVDFNRNRDTATLTAPSKFTSDNEITADLYWYLIFDQNIPLRNELLTSFIDLLKKTKKLEARYLESLGDKFHSSEDIGISMRIMIEMKNGVNRSELLEFFEEKKLLGLCLESCISFHKTSKAMLIKDSSMIIKETGLTWIEQAKLYLEMLHLINFLDKNFKLDNTVIHTLWTLYFLEALSLEHENLLWNILRRINMKNCLGFCYTKEEVDKFFNDYLTNEKEFPINRITTNNFECFKEYSKFLNTKDSISKDLGTEFMWQIALRANDFTFEQVVIEYIIDESYEEIHKNSKKSSEILQGFIQQILLKEFKTTKEARTSLMLIKRLTTA
jgi:hypothetical protein